MPKTITRPAVNGVLETSLYVKSVAQSLEFYQRVFGFELIDASNEEITDHTRLCALRAGDRDVLLLFKKGARRTRTRQDPSMLRSGSPAPM